MTARRTHDPEANAAAYVSGEFAGRARRWFERHLLDCEDCWREVWIGREGRRVAESARELAPVGLREDVRAAVLLTEPRRRRWTLLPVLATLAVVSIAVAGVALSRAGREPEPIAAALAAFRSGDTAPSSSAQRPAPDLSDVGFRLFSEGSVTLGDLRADRFDYRTSSGARVLLFLSDEPFPQANDAVEHGGSVHGWEAEADGLSLVCGERPVGYLFVGENGAILDGAEAALLAAGVMHS